MLISDVVTRSRQLLNDPSTTGRWTDTTLLGYYNEAANILSRDCEFPEGRFVITTVANQQEYATPELVKVYRVYMNGQLLVPQDLQTLEGHQIQLYDQGLNSGVNEPGTQTPGSGGPVNNQGSYTPAVWIEPPAAYPVANDIGAPGPDAAPWLSVAQGGRPVYYWRGGAIGLVPAPAGAYTLTIDCLPVYTDQVATNVNSIFPYNYRLALAAKMCELAKLSDDDADADRQMMRFLSLYEKEMRKLRINRKSYDGDQKRMPKFLTQRSFFYIGNNRNSSYWNEYP